MNQSRFFPVLPSLLVAWLSSFALQAQPLTIQGVTDRMISTTRASFRVMTNAGFTYEVTLNGQPVPAGVSNTVLVADYYDLVVQRTQTSSGSVTNALVRFIVLALDRGDTETGLQAWVPYPSIPSTAAELAGAHLDIIVPAAFPTGMEIPVVAWIRNGQSGAVRANGSLSAAGHPSITLRRGVGSGFLAATNPAGALNYSAHLPGLQASKTINLEANTTWTSVGGSVSGNTVWGTDSRIAVTNHVTVTAGSTLTIRNGSIVRLNAGVNITNLGHIVIEGSVDRPVVFTPVNRAQPWGGFLLPAAASQLDGTGVIFTGSGSRQSGFPGHRPEQPLFYLSNRGSVALTNAAAIDLAGQFEHSLDQAAPYASVTLRRTLIQRCTTAGEFNGCSLSFLESAMIEVPYEDPFYCADPDCDYDGFYLNQGIHELRDSLVGWVKDDCVDSGSGGGPTSVIVSNCWVEAAFHEGLAWSGGGRTTITCDTVLINNGQAFECGWSTGHSPIVYGTRLLCLANSIGARYGDNYTGTTGLGFKDGVLTVSNSVLLQNHHDVWGHVWDNTWNYRVAAMDIHDNFFTAANTNHPDNQVWNPSVDGSMLAAYMTTVPNAPVGLGLALWPHQLVPSMLTNGVAVRLSSFTTNEVSVDYSVITPSGTLAHGTLTFRPGETIKKITLTPAAVQGLSLLQVSLSNPRGGEITGPATAYLVNAPAIPQPPSTILIPFGSTWKYRDDGSNQGINWRNPGFNDASWSNGVAQFGFGDMDENTRLRATNGAGAAIATYYFRKNIAVSDPSQFARFQMQLLRDDAGIVYFNGTEVLRSPNMPPGEVPYNAFTGGTAPPDNTIDATNLANTGSVLLTGSNLIAVEIHQQSAGSSDASFDLELVGEPPSLIPLYYGLLGSNLILYWSDPTFRLESTAALPGGWQPVANGASPYVIQPSGLQRFYRLRQ